MKAGFLKSPRLYETRELVLRDPGYNELILDVKTCGLCGYDLIQAETNADWTPFGHEISGIVRRVGAGVTHFAPGDHVVLESGVFDRFADCARNGRVDLAGGGPGFWCRPGDPMGFAEAMVVPEECCVRAAGISHRAGALIEPMGVAYDMVNLTEIHLGDDVMVVGLGPIGLMALRMARLMGARRVYGVQTSGRDARERIARAWGADEILHSDKQQLSKAMFDKKGLDRIMVTAPPKLIPEYTGLLKFGGILSFIGIEFGAGASATFDMNQLHFNKTQLRASHASPALYFPRCLELVRERMLDLDILVTHTISLDHLQADIEAYLGDRSRAIKAIYEA